MIRRTIIATLLVWGLITLAYAYKRETDVIKITHSTRTKALSPEEQLAKFKLADGFVIELVASEKNGIINPIDLTFDDAGRLWTQTAEMYPLDPMGDQANRTVRTQIVDPTSKIHKHPEMVRLRRLYQMKDKGTDRIVVIDDPTKPVEGQVRRVAEGLTMPQSILPYKNGVYVAHGSEMLYLEDVDGDGFYEKPNTVLTGFSYIDSHTMSHLLIRAPGGWINFSHGAMNLGEVTAVASGSKQFINYCKIARFSQDGKKLELVSSGLNNIWGYQVLSNGQWYGSEANDKGMSIVPMEAGTGYLGIGNDKIRPYQPMVPQLHKFRVGGTGLSGLAYSESDSNGFPEEWQNIALLANPITNTINAVKINRDDAGQVNATHLDDLLKCEDDWFRPVNLEFGPDGCLYIADWYNKVVSHNEIPRTDPSRDKTHGRIWRVRHVSQKPAKVPNLLKAKDEMLVSHLSGPTMWEKSAAWHQIADRQVKSLLPELKTLISDRSQLIGTRTRALWAYESLGEFDEAFSKTLLQDSDSNIRREAVRSLASFELAPGIVAALLSPLVEDPNCMVRSQVLRTVADLDKADVSTIELLIKASKPPLPGKIAMGGSYERLFERYLARMAMEKYRGELKSYLSSLNLDGAPDQGILWALQSLDENSFVEMFPRFWSVDDVGSMDEEMFVSLSTVIKNDKIQKLVAPMFADEANHKHLSDLLVKTEGRVNSSAYKALFKPVVNSLAENPEADQKQLYKMGLILKESQLASHVLTGLKKDKSEASLNAALPILMLNPKANLKPLAALARDKKLPDSSRIIAIEAFNRANLKAAYPLLKSLISSMDIGDKRSAVNRLSYSTQGSISLTKLISEKVITPDDFSYLSASRVHASARKNRTAVNLRKIWVERKAKSDSRLAKKVDNYAEAATKLKGNPAVGEGLFQSCLTCHAVGEKGFSIAPALDGSASRETHALLTAIMRPDVAVEGGYELYRVIRKDGTIVEGLLHSSNDIGITIAQPGNRQVFTPLSDVRSHSGVAGKSFMIAMMNDLPEQNMVDLLSYIKTLQ